MEKRKLSEMRAFFKYVKSGHRKKKALIDSSSEGLLKVKQKAEVGRSRFSMIDIELSRRLPLNGLCWGVYWFTDRFSL